MRMFFKKVSDHEPLVHHLNKWRYAKTLEPARYFISNSMCIKLDHDLLNLMMIDADLFLDYIHNNKNPKEFFALIGAKVEELLTKDKSWITPIVKFDGKGNSRIERESNFQPEVGKNIYEYYRNKNKILADIMCAYILGLHGIIFSSATQSAVNKLNHSKLDDISSGFKLIGVKDNELNEKQKLQRSSYERLNEWVKSVGFEYYRQEYF